MSEHRVTRRTVIAGSVAVGTAGLLFGPLGFSRAPSEAELKQTLGAYLMRPVGWNESTQDVIIPEEMLEVPRVHLASSVAGGVGRLASPPMIGLGGLGLAVLRWIGRFAWDVGVELVSEHIMDWMATRDNREQRNVRDANRMMATNGFDDFREPKVYGGRDVFSYGLGHNKGTNGCFAVFSVNRNTGKLYPRAMMFEGPAVMGMAEAAHEWEHPNVEVGAALIPRETDKRDNSKFEESMAAPIYSWTDAGRMGLYYEKQPRRRTGAVRVGVVDKNDDWLFQKTYSISWT